MMKRFGALLFSAVAASLGCGAEQEQKSASPWPAGNIVSLGVAVGTIGENENEACNLANSPWQKWLRGPRRRTSQMCGSAGDQRRR